MATTRLPYAYQRHEPLSALAVLRERAGMTQQDVATELGVSRTTVLSWEKGETDPGTRYLRGLAIVLGCGVADLLNGRIPPSRLERWVERWRSVQPLYGTVQLRFLGAGGYDYPLSHPGRTELLYAVNSRGRVPWVGFDTYDSRLVFINCHQLESLSLVPAMAKSLVKQDELVYAETVDQKRLYVAHNDETFELISRLLTITEEPESVVDVELMNDWVACLGLDRGNELLHYRLGALRLIETPLEPYREAVTKVLAGR